MSIYGTFFIVYIKWACELIRRLVVINPITCSFKNWQNLFKMAFAHFYFKPNIFSDESKHDAGCCFSSVYTCIYHFQHKCCRGLKTVLLLVYDYPWHVWFNTSLQIDTQFMAIRDFYWDKKTTVSMLVTIQDKSLRCSD